MSEPKRRILARRSAFIAAAFSAAACDRCATKSEPCLAVGPPAEDAAAEVPSIRPLVCLSMPIPYDAGVSADASKDGAVKLQAIDITVVDSGAVPVPMTCLSVVRPPPTVCLRMPSKKEE